MVPQRASSGFGQRLRDARERRGVTLRQIANATKISVGVLEALERNDISKLPGGIFGRAFVRSYAIEVGLDPEATIQDFIAQFQGDAVVTSHQIPDDVESLESDRRTMGTMLWLAAIGVPIAAGVLYFGAFGRQIPVKTPAPPAIERAAETPAAAQSSAASTSSAARSVPSAVGDAATPAAVNAAPAVSAAAVPAATSGPVRAEAPVAAAASGNQLTVALTVKRPCWVSATVDGRKSLERLLQSGERQTITVRREMVITAGDASAIALQFNGADARPLGKSGEVVTARFNLTNYKDYLQAR